MFFIFLCLQVATPDLEDLGLSLVILSNPRHDDDDDDDDDNDDADEWTNEKTTMSTT